MVRRRAAEQATHPDQLHRVAMVPLLVSLLVITYYIGYFGAGAGLLTMTALALCGIERIAEINALKVVITTVANAVASITFIIGGAVEWRYCWLMMIACAIGGYAGARNSRRISDRILRPIIIVLGFVIAIYFFIHQKRLYEHDQPRRQPHRILRRRLAPPLSFVPQLVRVWRLRSAREISLIISASSRSAFSLARSTGSASAPCPSSSPTPSPRALPRHPRPQAPLRPQ